MKYVGPITITTSETLKVIAAVNGNILSPVTVATYTIEPASSAAAFSPVGGSHSGATISGTTPTTPSTVYAGPITVTSNKTVAAIAVETGYFNSPMPTAAHAISSSALSAPTFSVAAGTYTGSLTVTLSDTSSEATIYYTTDGTTPTTSSTKYSGAIKVSATQQVKAIAVQTGRANSPAAVAKYTVTTAEADYKVFPNIATTTSE
jgi:hypothetical protein